MHEPRPYRIRGDEIDPPEDDYEERYTAYEQACEDRFERERDEQTERELMEEGR